MIVVKELKEENSMNKKKTITERVASITDATALKMVQMNANSACSWLYHQPEFPKEAEKFKKVR